MHPIPANPVNFDDLDDTTLVPTGKTARELKESVELGIGPICRQKWGL